MIRYLSPTALCESQEAVIVQRPAGAAAEEAMRTLRRFWPALLFLPARGNIAIRQRLILSALELEADHAEVGYLLVRRALADMRSLCSVRLPYLEGWSYLLYVRRAYEYWSLAWGGSSEWEKIFAEQAHLASLMALPCGMVPTIDTWPGETVTPSTEDFATTPAFSVWRKGGYKLLWHDARIANHRMNLHVENTFGREVKEPGDWPWYSGWRSKRVSILWRLLPLRMRIIERGASRVVLWVRGRRKVISP